MITDETFTILNVDDYEVKRYARSHILRQAGFQVREASNGTDTLRIVGEMAPDLVLLDVNLPDINGMEVCRRIKSNPATASTMVLHISSTFTDKSDRTHGLENGADAYLVEPADPAELLAGVNALLRLRKAENLLRTATQEWRTTFDAIEDGVCLLDRGGHIRRCNQAFGRIFNQAPGKLIGIHCRELLGAECDGFDRMAESRGYQSAEIVLGDRIFEAGFSPIPAGDHAINGGVCSLRDVTIIRKAREERDKLLEAEQAARAEAEAANRIKDDFLAAVSHDLRGPLQAMLIWTQLLRDPDISEASRQRTIESLDRSAHAQGRLIDDLLDMSRIISGRLRVSLVACDIRTILLLTMETIKPAAEARQIAVELEIGRDPAPALCDPDRMQQVFWNLLANAVKFTPQGGRVTLRLERLTNMVRVSVSDNGEGIDPGLLPHVFENFRQGVGAPKGRTGGLGLGLSIARRLVELHGGTIEATSPGKDQGATFTVCLPVNQDPQRSGRAGSSLARS